MIKNLFELIAFSQKFAGVTRTVKLGTRDAYESDAEHSYQVGLIAWYLAEKLNLGAKRGKILEYALVHDLVEVYAHDTDPHRHSEKFQQTKAAREQQALARIKSDFLDFPSLSENIANYEKHEDIESRLVYIVDKILPVINTYLSHHTYYIDNNVSFEKWQSWLREKISNIDAEELLGKNFFSELEDFLKNHSEIFAPPNEK
jgi:5'-deoxynucleotidase YfbR-like HD superfamily hydrolase